MDLIIDANILFAALIKKGTTLDVILNENIHLIAPEFLFDEFVKYKDLILKKTGRSKQELDDLLNDLKNIITIIPKEEFFDRLLEAAVSPDPDDLCYFALALKLNIPIWSNDKKLKEQNTVKIYSTKDVLDMF